jgi:hypothetical protein
MDNCLIFEPKTIYCKCDFISICNENKVLTICKTNDFTDVAFNGIGYRFLILNKFLYLCNSKFIIKGSLAHPDYIKDDSKCDYGSEILTEYEYLKYYDLKF